MRHEVHAYDYVNGPYETVRTALLAAPLETFRKAKWLHAQAGPFEVGSEIAIELVEIEEMRAPDDRPAAIFTLAWKALHRPELFPTMHATLRVYALTPTETQLDLAGSYEPPLGPVGAALDTVVLHKVADATVVNFVREVAEYLRDRVTV